MKHVIIIETVDGSRIPLALQNVLERALEIGVGEDVGPCSVYGKYNVQSAIAATHEMFGAPEWKGGL